MARGQSQGVYRRGPYWLDLDRRRDGSPRSPNYYIFWYDPERGRTVSTSTGTATLEAAQLALDVHFLKETGGRPICKACGQTLPDGHGMLVLDAIADYLVAVATKRASEEAIRARLAHVVNYIANLPDPAVPCSAVNEQWIAEFRLAAVAVPIANRRKDGTLGAARQRSPSTIENSVIQLAAAIKHTTGKPPGFKPIQTTKLNRSPTYRASLEDLGAMLRWCMDGGDQYDPLRRFIIFSIATSARPDAVHDFSTQPQRQQWLASHQLINLNPKGRSQTTKHRPMVKCPRQLVALLNAEQCHFVRSKAGAVASVKTAWRSMTEALQLPCHGTKDIRRSMAVLMRQRGVPTDEIEMQLGHRTMDPTTLIYAPYDPAYLLNATKSVEGILDELLTVAPGYLDLK
jgi:hypothetical protein